MVRHLLLLNGLATLGAVVYHVSGWGFTSLFWWADRYQQVAAVPDFSQQGSASYYFLRVLEQLSTPSVPAFLFVSGFFVAFAAGRDARNLGWAKVGNRIKALLIPYLLWSLAIFVARGAEGSVEPPAGYLGMLVFGRAADPYYYVPLIVQLYLLSPFIVIWLKDRWKPALVAAGLIQVGVQLARYPVLLSWDFPGAEWIVDHAPSWSVLQAGFWFVLGACAGFHLPGFKQWLARWRPALPWATAAVGLMAILEWELLLRFSGREWLGPTATVLDTLYSGGFILTFMAFARANLPARWALEALGEKSFGVYLIQAPVLELASRGFYHVIPLLLAYQVLLQPILIVVGVGVPLLLMMIVNRSAARPYYSYLFG